MLNFAILAAGNISERMARTLDGMRGEVCPYAVAARDGARAAALAERFGFVKSYAGYDAPLADPAVDVVYIGSIHPTHARLIRAALLAGKHVLCEKPITLNAAQAEPLFELARQKHLLLAEAMWTRCLPFAQALRGVLESGRLGEPRLMSATICGPFETVPRIAQPALGGGALLDIGIYALTLACLAFAGEIEQISGTCTCNAAGADLSESISLRFSGGGCAALAVSAQCGAPHCASVICTNGRIEIEGPLWRPDAMTVCTGTPGNEVRERTEFDAAGTGFEPEVRAVAAALAAGKTECPELPAAETLRVLRAMDTLRAAWGVRYPDEDARAD